MIRRVSASGPATSSQAGRQGVRVRVNQASASGVDKDYSPLRI